MISIEHYKTNILVKSWTLRLLTCAGIGLSGEFQGSVEPEMTGKTGSHMDISTRIKQNYPLSISVFLLTTDCSAQSRLLWLNEVPTTFAQHLGFFQNGLLGLSKTQPQFPLYWVATTKSGLTKAIRNLHIQISICLSLYTTSCRRNRKKEYDILRSIYHIPFTFYIQFRIILQ